MCASVITYEFIGYFVAPLHGWGENKIVAVQKIHNPTMPPAPYEIVHTLFLVDRYMAHVGNYTESFSGSELEVTLQTWIPISREEALEQEPELVALVDAHIWHHAVSVPRSC